MDENLGLGVQQYAYVGSFDARFLEFGFGSFSALCKIGKFLKTLLLSQFSSDSSKLYTRYHNHTGVTFYGDLPKLQKLWHFEIFLNTGPYAAGIVNFSHNFHWSPSKLCDNIGYHGKSECLLEYCNENLASST